MLPEPIIVLLCIIDKDSLFEGLEFRHFVDVVTECIFVEVLIPRRFYRRGYIIHFDSQGTRDLDWYYVLCPLIYSILDTFEYGH